VSVDNSSARSQALDIMFHTLGNPFNQFAGLDITALEEHLLAQHAVQDINAPLVLLNPPQSALNAQ
jgi:hypothetical protein